ncbi:uncharacterized protein N7515_000263 [Penicillium bovifimosum]|uniref:Protein kinase domain-containing protein n=1 Tax=Penicillium bovifimosum TaxID=126998 RepID=A0A9W9HFM2_9EURO|nr:uncharacterized protein N7515_000263 [Penicillium bovifimosum]KAJ5145699.1 hypothetical protein N7515_000263 [Penicillium bovifimosum]
MKSSLAEEKLFTPLLSLESEKTKFRHFRVGSESDLDFFIRNAVEFNVSNIVEELYKDPTLREAFELKGSIQFENHANRLSPEQEIEDGVRDLEISPRPTAQRCSRRLAGRAQSEPGVTAPPPPSTPAPATVIRPRADHFCVYNVSGERSETSRRVAAYIKEFRCPHKVTLGHIYGGLEDMDVDQVLKGKEKETSEDRLRRVMAGLLTQPFDYMIRAGTKRAVFSTGEADIYLRIDEDPSTLFYHLSVPKGDVGDTTGWDPSSDSPNRLHLTAVGQALAFTVQALKLHTEPQSWIERAANSLPKWKVVVEDILKTISKEDTPSSEYRPARLNFTPMSPIRLRPRPPPKAISSCQSSQTIASSDEDDSDSPDAPSRTSQASGNHQRNRGSRTTQTTSTSGGAAGTSSSSQQTGNRRRYCTVACLRGLISRGELDKTCPNAAEHGTTHHRINSVEFLDLLRRQLDETVNADCESLGIHGARGALLKVSLSSHGYTVPAKCTTAEFTKYLKHEALVYKKLRPLQGINVPLYLGSIDLTHPYSYEGICYLVHMMLLGPGGFPLRAVLTPENEASMSAKTKESLSAVHRLGVLHRDAELRNFLYNSETDNVIILDFERAEILKQRPALGLISPNRKRKHASNLRKSKEVLETAFIQEMNSALWGVRCPNSRFRVLTETCN